MTRRGWINATAPLVFAVLAACGPSRGDGPSLGLDAAPPAAILALCADAAGALDAPLADAPAAALLPRAPGAACVVTMGADGRLTARARAADGAAEALAGDGFIRVDALADPFGGHAPAGARVTLLGDQLWTRTGGHALYAIETENADRRLRALAVGGAAPVIHDDGVADRVLIAQLRETGAEAGRRNRGGALGMAFYSTRYDLPLHTADRIDAAAPTLAWFVEDGEIVSAIDRTQMARLAQTAPGALFGANARLDAAFAAAAR